MAILPPHVFTCRIIRRRAYFTRYGCEAIVSRCQDGAGTRQTFFGEDGRKVRAEAIAWAHMAAESYAVAYISAWRDVYDTARIARDHKRNHRN